MLFERLKHAACALWTRSKQQQYCDMVSVLDIFSLPALACLLLVCTHNSRPVTVVPWMTEACALWQLLQLLDLEVD
jgi:hypothetical protein